ncbi:MAG TPA: alpha/beta hydrolase [Candidatus Binatia bacterium]|nr:alpha/beta hydrolase [Candidatus Binatia bacterium]
MAIARLTDVEIYYEVHGSGEPVLLAPASWWPSDTWNVGVVPFLSKRFKTIVFDCRGTGRSSQPSDGYTVSQFAQDCLGLLGHLGISRCHAVGFALGGQVMQALAIERPDIVVTLTIAASGAGTKTLAGGRRSLSPDTEREIQTIGFERYIRNYIENDTMAFNPQFYRERGDVVAALADAVWSGQSTVETFRRHEDARLTWDTLEKAAEIKVPALILCGADDDVARRGSTPVGTAQRLAELTVGSELFLIPNTKHMTFWDGSGGLIALEEFLVRHSIEKSR